MERSIIKHVGKGSSSELLPTRTALNSISGGDASQRTINRYSKVARNILHTGPNLIGTEPGE